MSPLDATAVRLCAESGSLALDDDDHDDANEQLQLLRLLLRCIVRRDISLSHALVIISSLPRCVCYKFVA